MAHETKQASAKEKQKHGHGHGKEDEIAIADDEIEEIELTQEKTFYDRITQVMEKFASNRLGQMIIEKTDRVLKVVEDTAKWSLPQDDSDMKLERPLPWIFFLNLIVWLRVIRIWLSVASYIVGSQPVTPHTMVYYIQTKRRRLRAIRVQGLKSIRNREIETTAMYSSNKNVSFIGKLRKLFGSAICKPGQHREAPPRYVYTEEGKESNNKTERSSKRPRDEEIVDHNLTVDEMLDKYANEDSDNDSDYVPKEDEDDDDSSTSHASSSSEEETEKEKPENPKDNQKESKESDKPQENSKPSAEKKDEIKENGGAKHRPKPKPLDNKNTESLATADSDKEEMHTPNEIAQTNGSNENEEHKHKTSEETPAATAEVAAPPSALNTPKSTHLSAPSLEAKQNKKSTPGHESAASLKPAVEAITKTAEEKSYRTITTQTAIELDWTITIKTEITHTKHYPKLEKINCSVNLTPASSTEDIFYSPIGSPQDFHHIFHPAPLVKGSAAEVQTSTPKEADHHESSSSETPETKASNNQKKHLNQPNNHPHKQNQHHNVKNRNKNRR